MLKYRLTALLLPTFLLLALPALAAYPWHFPIGANIALPCVTLMIILFGALRYPDLFLSPMVFLSGLLCDLFTRSPLGFWTLLFLLTLACARTITLIVERYGRFAGYLGFFLTLIIMTGAIWGLGSLYQFEWLEWRTSFEGMVMGFVLLPIPVLLLVGFEKLLILKNEKQPSNSFGSRLR